MIYIGDVFVHTRPNPIYCATELKGEYVHKVISLGYAAGYINVFFVPKISGYPHVSS